MINQVTYNASSYASASYLPGSAFFYLCLLPLIIIIIIIIIMLPLISLTAASFYL
jgi:hypothetical protein